jgi:hypothetical protein
MVSVGKNLQRRIVSGLLVLGTMLLIWRRTGRFGFRGVNTDSNPVGNANQNQRFATVVAGHSKVQKGHLSVSSFYPEFIVLRGSDDHLVFYKASEEQAQQSSQAAGIRAKPMRKVKGYRCPRFNRSATSTYYKAHLSHRRFT